MVAVLVREEIWSAAVAYITSGRKPETFRRGRVINIYTVTPPVRTPLSVFPFVDPGRDDYFEVYLILFPAPYRNII